MHPANIQNSQLPSGWRWVKLGEVCDYNSGIWGDEPDNSPMCYPVLRSNNIRHGKMVFDDIAIRKVDEKYLLTKTLNDGDILVTTSSGSKDLLGKSAIFVSPKKEKTYLFSNFSMRLRPKPEIIDPFYLYFYLQSPEAKEILKSLQDTTTGLRNMDRKEFLNQMIPLPPLSEQKRIAGKIKGLLQEVENARTACEKQLETINTLPQSILKKAFAGEL